MPAKTVPTGIKISCTTATTTTAKILMCIKKTNNMNTNPNNLGSGYGSTMPLNTYQTGACAVSGTSLSTPTKCLGNNSAATMFCNASNNQVPFSPPSNMKLFYEPPKNC